VASGEEKTWIIVGGRPAEPKAGEISIGSPIAVAVVGHSPGDRVTVSRPIGLELEIVAVDDPGS
jgi:transcription elongation factor GreA